MLQKPIPERVTQQLDMQTEESAGGMEAHKTKKKNNA
jgi:hypothetical protein